MYRILARRKKYRGRRSRCGSRLWSVVGWWWRYSCSPSPPAPVQMPATNRLLNELERDPLMKLNAARPTPPVPSYPRVGVQGDDVLTLSLNDAIRRALENNSDIEVARGDVRVRMSMTNVARSPASCFSKTSISFGSER